MAKHIIPDEDQTRLPLLEAQHDFAACSSIVSQAIERFGNTLDADMRYELGAAYLRLSVYQLILGSDEAHEANLGRARQLLPRFDLLALAAGWLDRCGADRQILLTYCDEFFEVVDKRPPEDDTTTRIHLEAMEDLRERLSTT